MQIYMYIGAFWLAFGLVLHHLQQLALDSCTTAWPLVLPRVLIRASFTYKGAKYAVAWEQKKPRDTLMLIVLCS